MTNESGITRLFFALPADGIQDFLQPVYERLNTFPRALKTVAPENYHITLKFLGETKQEIFQLLHQDFQQLGINSQVVPYTLRGLGAFPDARRARVLWCGLDVNDSSICLIQNAIEELCVKYGFKKENRAFQPHLTLARTRKEMKTPVPLFEYITANRNTVFGESIFKRIVLFKSDLRRDGPVYTAVEERQLV
jgi:RNA 2',3'-cyclic 3'-phosphodiesterase